MDSTGAAAAPTLGAGRRRALIGLAWVAGYLILWMGVEIGTALGGAWLGGFGLAWISMLFHGGAEIAAVLLLTWLFRVQLNRAPWSDMALPKPQLARLGLGALAGVGMILMLSGIEYLAGWLHLARIDLGPHRGIAKPIWSALALAPSLGVGFVEELGFRGYVYRTFGERAPAWTAALLMSVVFALCHFTLGGFGFGFVVSAAVTSLMFLALRYATGSLWFPIGFHGAWDWTQTYLIGLSTVGGGYDPALAQIRQTGPALWVGDGQAIEGGLLFILAMIVLLGAALAYARRSGRLPALDRPLPRDGLKAAPTPP